MNNPMESFGTLEPTAHFILQRASELARSTGQALDPLHLLYIVLSEPTAAGSTAGSLDIYLPDDLRRVCVATIKVELQLHGQPAAPTEDLSLRMQACADDWKQEAELRHLRVTEALVVWVVVGRDAVAGQVLRTLGVDVDGLLHHLERHFEITSKLPPLPSHLGSDLRDHIDIVSPSTGCQFSHAHAVLMQNVLNILGNLQHAQIAILSGRNGTPIGYTPAGQVSQVLAEQLASGSLYSDDRPRLQADLRGVYRLNLPGVLGLAALPNKRKPYEVVQDALRLAAQERAILVISNLEMLKEQTPAHSEVLAALKKPDGALVLGIYEQSERSDRLPSEVLDLGDATNVVAHSYPPLQTRQLINQYYLPTWTERYHITLTDDAFDHVIALEPGAWINSRRKTLPYLAVGLASDTIQTVMGGETLVRDTAIMALDALVKLEDEAATTESRLRARFESVLEEARVEISRLLDDPMPATDERGNLILTRAYLSAQLICPNDSEFHYPGHAPESLTVHYQDDLPIHLRPVRYL